MGISLNPEDSLREVLEQVSCQRESGFIGGGVGLVMVGCLESEWIVREKGEYLFCFAKRVSLTTEKPGVTELKEHLVSEGNKQLPPHDLLFLDINIFFWLILLVALLG